MTEPPGRTTSIESTTAVVPSQWKRNRSPATCGKRPVAMAGSQAGENPLTRAAVSCSPVRVSITVRLPKGRTAKTSPHVISLTASPPDGGAPRMSARSPPELVSAASMPG